jgi:hypothetical protein
VAITHIAVLEAALVALIFVPCAVVALVGGEQLLVRRGWLGRGRREARVLRRLDRHLQIDVVLPIVRGAPCIEQIAAELRRLDRQRRTGPSQCSERWSAEVIRAYDSWLQMACRCLREAERLDKLTGAERDSERLRVEWALESAGLSLRSRS